MKGWMIALLIVLGIIILICLLIFITPKIGLPCGHSRGTSCPSYSNECSCLGIKVSESPFSIIKKGGGYTYYYCLGKVSDCRCYEEGCPASTGYKKEINCSSLQDFLS